MYINPVDQNNVVSFLHGYELGTGNKCQFTLLVRQLLTHKYRIVYSNDGWPGQIVRLAKNASGSWLTTFMEISAEIIGSEESTFVDNQEPKD